GIGSVGFYYAPVGGGSWTALPGVLPVKPGAPVAPGSPELAPGGILTFASAFNTGGVAAGKYVFRVLAIDTNGRTTQQFDSFVIGVAGARGPPTTGFNLSVTPSSTGMSLSWTGISGDYFQIRRSIDSSPDFISLGTTTSSQLTDWAVIPGHVYRYQIVRLSPATAFTTIVTAIAVSSFNSAGKASSTDGSVGVSLPSASSGKVAVDVAPDTAPPALPSGISAVGAAYDVNATSYSSGLAVHQLDQPATLTFAVPAGMSQAQAQALSVYHYDVASGTWVREPTTLDWANKQIIATVTHFSLF